MSSEWQRLLVLKTKLGANVEILKQQYETAKSDYHSVVRAMELLDTFDAGDTETDDLNISSHEIDFTGALNIASRMERIAEKSNGRVNCTKAAEILIDSGQSLSKKRNLVASIYRTLSANDRWERVSPGTFQFLCAEHNASQGDIDVQPEIGLLNSALDANRI